MQKSIQNQLKAKVAERAVQEVESGMVVGLGTGTTMRFVIEALGRRVAAGLRIEATATSRASEALAARCGIPLRPFADLERVDLGLDGADELDGRLWAIKGGGGALLREKIVATAAERMIVLVDASKRVETLGRFPLALEVLPFAEAFVLRRLAQMGLDAQLRRNPDGSVYTTDQANYILDAETGPMLDPPALAAQLAAIPGLLEHGLFLSEIDEAFVATDGELLHLLRS